MRIKLFGHILYVPSWVKFLLILIFFIVLAIIGYNIRSEKDIIKENPDLLLQITPSPYYSDNTQPSTKPTSTYNSIPTTSPAENITVYIVGCVKNPSVVTVPYGSIIQNAVDKAGGLTDNADPSRINMAYPLSDNMMIKIPSRSDTDHDIGVSGNEWIITSQPKNTPTAKQENDTQNTNKKININSADIKTLCNLPGIGESTAQKIIDFRNENGLFEHIEDIMKIPGIKKSRFDSIKDMITVG